MKSKLFASLLLALYFARSPIVSAQAPASATPSAQASLDQDIALLRKDIADQKKQLVAANLVLTPAEATKFWPVYDQYQAEYSKIGDAKLALIKDYAANWGSVTDQQALLYLRRSQDIDESVIKLRQKYVTLFNAVIPGKKTATFFQIDRRIGLLMDVKIASEVPLVQSQTTTP